jgi:hypothetical protein
MYISNPRDSSEDPDMNIPGKCANSEIAFPNRLIAPATRLPPYTSRPLVHITITCRGVNRFREKLTIYYVKYSL